MRLYFFMFIFLHCFLFQTKSLAQANNIDTCLYSINEDETNKMRVAYPLYFTKDGLTTDFFIPKCAMKAMAEFAKQNSTTITGFRFFWGSKGNMFGLNHKSRLIIVPTKKATLPVEKYPNDYSMLIPVDSDCALPNNVFWAGKNKDALKWIDNFGEKFREEPVRGSRQNAKKDPLSLAVWISSCKIESMYKVLEKNTELTGMRAYCASYYKSDDMSNSGERPYAVQSTLLFIPTNNDFKVNWSELKNISGLVKKPIKTLTDVPTESYNHGALCPNQCN